MTQAGGDLRLGVFGLMLVAAVGCPESTPAKENPLGASATPGAADKAPLKLAGRAMGTTWSVTIAVAQERTVDRKVIEKLIANEIEQVEARMSTWRPTSELSRFNASRSTDPFPVSAQTALVTDRAKEIGLATQGAFDVTLGPLIALWGFDKDGRRTEPPEVAKVEAARARVGLRKLLVIELPPAGEGPRPRALKKTTPDLEVNLSGIAKGYGVDVVYDALVERGLTDLMVEIGGEVRTLGNNPKGQPWRIGVNVPKSTADPREVLRAVPVSGRAVATSGSYRNFFTSKDKRYSHIIDPRTGAPTDHHLVSATVMADDCTTADALATAALVLGEERFRAVLADHFAGVEALFVHAAPPGEGASPKPGQLEVTSTAGFPAP